MYIWIGIDVDSQLIELKKKALLVDNKVGFKNSCFTLPLHITLNTSFKVSKTIFDSVIQTIISYYASITPFEIMVDKVEMYENIVWVKMDRNKQLDNVHDDLNKILMDQYNIGMHEYDLDYQYHTTLFMDNSAHHIMNSYNMVKDEILPYKVIANQFLIGISETGELGTYHIYKSVRRK